METNNKEAILFYRLWSLEYVFRNSRYKALHDKIISIEQSLGSDLVAIAEEYIRKYSPGNDYTPEIRSFFSDDFGCIYYIIEMDSYQTMSKDKQQILLSAVQITEEVWKEFGFPFDACPAQHSSKLVENILDRQSLIFPEDSRGVSVGASIMGGPWTAADPINKIVCGFAEGKPFSIEDKPGQVVLSLNFSEPLPVLIDFLGKMYRQYHGQEKIGAADYAIEYSRIVNGGECCPERQVSRAVGIWLWDYEITHDCTQKKAIDALNASGYLSTLGLENVEESDLRFFLRRTKECIEAAKVLPFTKKGTKKPKRVPGT